MKDVGGSDLIVVAGGGGFIGAHLARTLVERGFDNVRAVDNKPLEQWQQLPEGGDCFVADLRLLDACYRATEGAALVFNFAADMGGMGFIEYQKTDCMLSGHHDIEIWGDGEQTRSFMYIDDCTEGTLRITDCDFPDPINLGSDRLVTINQLVDIVEGIAEVKLRRIYNLDASKGGRNSDNTLIHQVLGWEPSISLKDGLEQTYRWIYDQLVAGRGDRPKGSAPLGTFAPS